MSGVPRWTLILLDWLSSRHRRWLSASRCDQSLVLEMPARGKAARPRAWMACRVIAVNQRELPRGLQRPGVPPVSPAPRWGLSPLDWHADAINELVHHPIGVYVARCGHRLMMLITLHESPPSRICLSRTRRAAR
jgi:hypothetical protein